MDLVKKNLNEMFVKRYAKLFDELNKHITVIPKENGAYDIPLVSLGNGGATVIKADQGQVVQLAPPSLMSISYKKVKSLLVIYRIAIPESEAISASESDKYFAYIFDPVLEQALAGYAKAFGPPDALRFGTKYCTFNRPSSELNDVFRYMDSTSSEYPNTYELKLTGDFASSEEVSVDKGNNT